MLIDDELKKIPDEKGTSAVVTSEEELLFICEQTSANLANEGCIWVTDSGASFHIIPRESASRLTQLWTMAV